MITDNKKFAIVFPGQGSQKLGMLLDFYEKYSIFRDTFNEANKALGFDLWNIVQNDNEKLNSTEYTQPAVLTSSVAIYRVLQEIGFPAPAVMAGHSLGEYSALVCSEVLSLKQAVVLVKSRGELMQKSVAQGVGAMSSILALHDDIVKNICLEASDNKFKVEIAAFNAVGHVVIAGDKIAVERANILAKEKKARMAKMLPVSVPSHCSLMNIAGDNLTIELNKINFSTPKIDIIQNVNLKCNKDILDIKTDLIKQLYSPVRWTETIEKVKNDYDINTIIEIGCGSVLSGLNKRIVKGLDLYNSSNLVNFDKILNLNED